MESHILREVSIPYVITNIARLLHALYGSQRTTRWVFSVLEEDYYQDKAFGKKKNHYARLWNFLQKMYGELELPETKRNVPEFLKMKEYHRFLLWTMAIYYFALPKEKTYQIATKVTFLKYIRSQYINYFLQGKSAPVFQYKNELLLNYFAKAYKKYLLSLEEERDKSHYNKRIKSFFRNWHYYEEALQKLEQKLGTIDTAIPEIASQRHLANLREILNEFPELITP